MKTSRPYLMMAAVVLLWGTNIIVSRFLTGLDPVRVSGVFYAFFRFAFGSITLVLAMLYKRISTHTIAADIRKHKRVLLSSVMFASVFVVVLHTSTEFIPSGTSSIIINLNPIIVLIFGVILLREKLTHLKLIGFFMGFLGGSMFLMSSLQTAPGFEIGIFLAVLGMTMWAAFTITLHYLEGANRYVVMTVVHVASSLVILFFIVGVFMSGVQLIMVWDIMTILGFLFAGVLVSGLGYLLYFSAIEALGASRAASFLFLMPFVSVMGDFLLGEPPTSIILLAGIIAVLGVGLVSYSRADEE